MIAMDAETQEAYERKHVSHKIDAGLMEEITLANSGEAFHMALSQLFFVLPDGHYVLTLERKNA